MSTTLENLRTALSDTEREIEQYAGRMYRKYAETELKDIVARTTEDESVSWGRAIELIADCWKWDGLDVAEDQWAELSGEVDDLFSMIHTVEAYREDIQFELDELAY